MQGEQLAATEAPMATSSLVRSSMSRDPVISPFGNACGNKGSGALT